MNPTKTTFHFIPVIYIGKIDINLLHVSLFGLQTNLNLCFIYRVGKARIGLMEDRFQCIGFQWTPRFKLL